MIVLLCVLLILIIIILAISYVCFRMAFYAPKKPVRDPEAIDIPEGEIYEVFREQMEQWVRDARALPKQHFTIRSFDGLQLHGTYYEYAPGAPIELMFHGYKGNAERDLSGGVHRCFRLGRSALIVDQRTSGESEGRVITMGIHESKDCMDWLKFMIRHFGPEVKIILTGISMGAATVMMAAGKELPPQVMGILADCGYNSPKEIICTIIKQMKIPPRLGYPFVKLGARIYGHFDLEETSPEEALKKAKVPVIFFHGDEDDFVPSYMSSRCFDACASRKKLVFISGAGHGLCFPVDPETYLSSLREFFGPEASA